MPVETSSNFFKKTMSQLCGTVPLTAEQQAQREEAHKIYKRGLAINEQIENLQKLQRKLMGEARDKGNERAERWLLDKSAFLASLFFLTAKQQPAQETYDSALAIDKQIQELEERQEDLIRQASSMGSADAQDWVFRKHPIFFAS